jgi:hypothetical protein
MFMPAPEIWGRLFFACTKRLLAPSGCLHQAMQKDGIPATRIMAWAGAFMHMESNWSMNARVGVY